MAALKLPGKATIRKRTQAADGLPEPSMQQEKPVQDCPGGLFCCLPEEGGGWALEDCASFVPSGLIFPRQMKRAASLKDAAQLLSWCRGRELNSHGVATATSRQRVYQFHHPDAQEPLYAQGQGFARKIFHFRQKKSNARERCYKNAQIPCFFASGQKIGLSLFPYFLTALSSERYIPRGEERVFACH